MHSSYSVVTLVMITLADPVKHICLLICSNCKCENITQDYSTSQELLARDNIDFCKLQEYALDAAHFSTDLPELNFAVSDHVISCDVL